MLKVIHAIEDLFDVHRSFLGDVAKLEQHLSLLREEYVKLQQRYKVLEKNYQVLTSTSKIDQDSFVYRLLKTVSDLFNRELYR